MLINRATSLGIQPRQFVEFSRVAPAKEKGRRRNIHTHHVVLWIRCRHYRLCMKFRRLVWSESAVWFAARHLGAAKRNIKGDLSWLLVWIGWFGLGVLASCWA